MSEITSPIHLISPHPTSPLLYLATSSSLHKYNLTTSSIEATYLSPNPDNTPHLLVSSPQWLFLSGDSKLLRVLNAETLESIAELSPLPPSPHY
jgi:hypothetical protein